MVLGSQLAKNSEYSPALSGAMVLVYLYSPFDQSPLPPLCYSTHQLNLKAAVVC